MKLLFTIFLSLLAIISYGQNSNNVYSPHSSISLNAGIGRIMNDYGFAMQGSYEYSPFKQFSFEANIQTISTYKGDSDLFEQIELVDNITNQYSNQFDLVQKAFTSIGLNAIYTPLNNAKNRLGIGLGFSYNFKTETSVKRTKFSQNDYESVVVVNDRNNGFAPTFLASYNYTFANNLILGIKAYFVVYDDMEDSIMLSVGYKLN